MPTARVRELPQPPLALDHIRTTLESGRTYLRGESKVVLVCGKRPNPESPGARDRILEYARKNLVGFKFFIAERIFDLLGGKGSDLLSLEESLLGFCDCVLIILESESTYAELGAFAIKDELVENMLVMNDRRFRRSESFISLGPLAKVDKMSKFGSVIHVGLDSVLRAAPEVSERLSRLVKHRNVRVDLTSAERFSGLEPKIRMLFLLDLVTFFQPVTSREIVHILATCYDRRKFKVSLDLHMLVALGLIGLVDDYYVRPPENLGLSFAYAGLKKEKLRAIIVNHYHKYDRKRVDVLRQRAGESL